MPFDNFEYATSGLSADGNNINEKTSNLMSKIDSEEFSNLTEHRTKIQNMINLGILNHVKNADLDNLGYDDDSQDIASCEEVIIEIMAYAYLELFTQDGSLRPFLKESLCAKATEIGATTKSYILYSFVEAFVMNKLLEGITNREGIKQAFANVNRHNAEGFTLSNKLQLAILEKFLLDIPEGHIQGTAALGRNMWDAVQPWLRKVTRSGDTEQQSQLIEVLKAVAVVLNNPNNQAAKEALQASISKCKQGPEHYKTSAIGAALRVLGFALVATVAVTAIALSVAPSQGLVLPMLPKMLFGIKLGVEHLLGAAGVGYLTFLGGQHLHSISNSRTRFFSAVESTTAKFDKLVADYDANSSI